MPNVVDSKLRNTPLESEEKKGLLWFLNREVTPTLRRILRFLNVSWGQTVEVTDTITVDPTGEYHRVNASAGDVVVNLRPSADAVLGIRIVTVKKIDSSANTVTIVADGTDEIDGSPILVLKDLDSVTRIHARTDGWDILGGGWQRSAWTGEAA